MLNQIGSLDERVGAEWVHDYLTSLTPEQHTYFETRVQAMEQQ